MRDCGLLFLYAKYLHDMTRRRREIFGFNVQSYNTASDLHVREHDLTCRGELSVLKCKAIFSTYIRRYASFSASEPYIGTLSFY